MRLKLSQPSIAGVGAGAELGKSEFIILDGVLGFENSQREIGTFFNKNPPPHIPHCPKFSLFFIVTPPLTTLHCA